MKRKAFPLIVSVASIAALSALNAHAQTTTINGGSLTMRSTGSASGSAWNIGTTGFVGTYITVPTGGGTVSFTVNASHGATGANNPHLNLVVADTKVGFAINSTTANNYTASTFLPAGTYVVRTERDYVTPAQASTRTATINSLTVGGATVVNSNNASLALAASDTYIQNFRRGSANVRLTGPGNIPLLAGTQVAVDHKRHAYMFGTAVPGVNSGNVSQYLGTGGTAQQTNYQSRLNQNFNAVVPENMGKWQANENTRDVNTMQGVDTILNYAQSNNMRARMHNMIWGTQQPTWATTLLSQAAAGNVTSKADLRAEITERAGYYIADRASKFVELDVYNETYHTGVQVAGSYWNVYGAAGIADVYREARDAAPNVKMYVNDYNIYADTNDGSKYANYYRNHTADLRNAGFTAGYGDVVGGIGTQYYVNNAIETGDPNTSANNGAHNAARIMQTMQALSTHGLPINLTEFGVKAGATQATAAQMLSDSLRVTFGNADTTGFMMWGYHAENGGGNLFAPAAALYNVNTANWNSWTITEAGKAWQDLLGIQDWDGNPNNAWTTHLNSTVAADGSIDFTGFYGDYNIGNQSGFANLNLVKGTNTYEANLALPPTWSMWDVNISGNWSDPNWSVGSAPDAVGLTAYFGPSPAARVAAVDSPRMLGMLAFNSTNSYTIGGNGTLTLDGAADVVAMYVANGSHSVTAPVIANDDLHVTVAPANSTLIVSNLQPTTHDVTKSGSGTLLVNQVRAASLSINDGTVSLITDGSRVGALALNTPTSTLDVDAADIVVEDGDYNAIAALIAAARNGGAWDEPGITSAAAAAHPSHATTLGVLVDANNDVLIRYTWYGDTDLNRVVNFDDYARIDAGFNNGLSGWSNGDFDLNGSIDFDDYALIDLAFNSQTGAPLQLRAVPEPGRVISLGVLTALAAVRRRRSARSA